MGSPIAAGRIASPGPHSPSATSGPSSLPYELSPGEGKARSRSITESSATAPPSRGPVSKVMDMFRNRSNSVSSDDKRRVFNIKKLLT